MSLYSYTKCPQVSGITVLSYVGYPQCYTTNPPPPSPRPTWFLIRKQCISYI